MKRIVTQMSLLAATAMIATGCVPVRHNLPPEQRMLEPGPGVGGPGPGVMGAPPFGGQMMGGMGGPMGTPMMGGPGMQGPMLGPGMMGAGNGYMPPGAIGAAGPDVMRSAPLMGTSASTGSGNVGLVNYSCGNAGCGCGGGAGGCLGGGAGEGSMIPAGGGYSMGDGSMMAAIPSTVQITLGQPDGMYVRYDATGAGMFDSEPLVVPARQNFPQGGLYRLKLTNIPSREGVELYPTVELAYSNPRTGAYLAHNSVPIQFTEEDFDQVLTGNFVTKVIYLPDPDFQGPALAGIDTLVSTRLDPGIDPIVEADRRGSILAIIRLGDKDIEMSGAGGIGGGLGAAGMYAPPIAGLPAPFAPAMTEGCGSGTCGMGGMGGGGSAGCSAMPVSLPGMVAGATAPQYGMPITGTPIGLPGPPHIPLGHPAGLKKHVIRNHTPMNIPRPVEKVKINVRQQPGMSYPNPVSRIHITEQNLNPGVPNGRGLYQHPSQAVDPNCNQ
ncbi:hypothetical protein Poly51_32660 [Rubripirellula tenax]|uniref:Uncharacterized protein n=1 Tax=Rubripirellula tenax TaxID=2528015 RepID=A0A5C6F2G2_9BACT|nr:hypothetical protein [Rubripirellula tenax]TWU54547.1 hypothetical protein Poly51_32660 [Rubripirellula tenax]